MRCCPCANSKLACSPQLRLPAAFYFQIPRTRPCLLWLWLPGRRVADSGMVDLRRTLIRHCVNPLLPDDNYLCHQDPGGVRTCASCAENALADFKLIKLHVVLRIICVVPASRALQVVCPIRLAVASKTRLSTEVSIA